MCRRSQSRWLQDEISSKAPDLNSRTASPCATRDLAWQNSAQTMVYLVVELKTQEHGLLLIHRMVYCSFTLQDCSGLVTERVSHVKV